MGRGQRGACLNLLLIIPAGKINNPSDQNTPPDEGIPSLPLVKWELVLIHLTSVLVRVLVVSSEALVTWLVPQAKLSLDLVLLFFVLFCRTFPARHRVATRTCG